LSAKTGQIEWRRAKVVEMKARGMSQIEISHELQVSKQLISDDVQYLRKRAKENIKEYVTEHLPEQYQICLSALDTILKHAFEILQEAHDNREKVAALQLFKDTHVLKLELLSNATTIDSALEFIRSKQSRANHHAQKEDSSDSKVTATATDKQSVF
jgi:transcriptional regulator